MFTLRRNYRLMKNTTFTILFTMLCLTIGFGQKKSPYKIYNAKGKQISYQKMLKDLKKQNFIFFGELHNNAIAHWLQYEITEDLSKSRDLILGAEMFERDNQEQLNAYLADKIDSKALDTLARLWPNFDTDYKPLLDFAKEQSLEFIATNIPRSYASKVYRGDFQALSSLSETEKKWVAPLPIDFDPELPTYKGILEMMGGHGSETLVKAQAIKDATMAYSIMSNYQAGGLFIHYNGSYHSDFHEGIIWYLPKYGKAEHVLSLTTVISSDIDKFDKEWENKADYFIVVDEHMTNTY